MWFVVCLFEMVAMIMLGNANSELIVCTTPSGSKGLCLVKEICPSIMRMERINTAITRLYIQNSICGYDENFVLSYCCAVKNFTGPVLSEFDDLIEKAHPGFLNPINEEVKPVVCRTPNGQKGNCVPIQQCEIFLDLITKNLADISEEQKLFLRASECRKRKEGQAPVVCCGPDTTYKNYNKTGTN